MNGNNIGVRIKTLRESKGLTQSELAKALNVKRETITHWENGTRDLKTESTIALASFFGVSCDEILTGNKPEYTCIASELGLSPKAIKKLLCCKKAADCTIYKNITYNDLALNPKLTYEMPFDLDIDQMLPEECEHVDCQSIRSVHGLNAIFDSDWALYLFGQIYSFLLIPKDSEGSFSLGSFGQGETNVRIRDVVLTEISSILNYIADGVSKNVVGDYRFCYSGPGEDFYNINLLEE